MVLLHLMGGLGNQMSQVAYAKILSIKKNQQLILDQSEYKHYKIRPCSIDKCVLDDGTRMMVGSDRNFKYYYMRFCEKGYHLYYRLFCWKRPMGEHLFCLLAKRGHYHSFDSDVYGFPIFHQQDVDVYGYFQAESCYREYKGMLKSMFAIKPDFQGERVAEYEEKIRQSECPVCISLRLQDDYVKNPAFNICTEDYFTKAIKFITDRFPQAHFYVFADDIERAKKMQLGIDVTRIEGVTDVEGMHLMQCCKHFIISNSSFSWWGAYLGMSNDKIVVAPDTWIRNGKDYSSKYYEGMIKIEC